MRESRQFEIAGDTYEITQLGAVTGRKVMLRLVHALGGAAKSLGESDKLDWAAIGGAIAGALDSIDDQTLDYLCETFGANTRLIRSDGKKPQLTKVVFDDHFASRYAAMTEWLMCCLEVNFADFFDGGADGLLARMGMLASKSPTASTGSSGDQ